MRLVECVPNISEGRRKEVIASIADSIKKVSGVTLLDVESNSDHNRSVISFVGEPGPVKEAALAAGTKAVELIDLNHHKGEHPRMGALDVVPFVPLTGVSIQDCAMLAREFGREFAEKLHVPVFLYEEAATSAERRNLADVRAGEFEGLREKIGKDPSKKPDFGPEAIHPTAGATAVGAREILIAYNVNLGTSDLNVAKQIAKELRSKDGGLAFVKALGFELKERGIVQVSMNMTNYRKSQLFKAYEMVKLFAERYGVPIVGSEIVGLTPMDALADSAEFYLRLENFSRDQVLERKLFSPRPPTLNDQSLSLFSEEVASRKATPGGGSVSAYMGSLAAALVCMVSRITLGRKAPASHAEQLTHGLRRSEELRARLLGLVVKDADAFDSVMRASRFAKQKPEARRKEVQDAIKMAAEVPLMTLQLSVDVLKIAEETSEIGAMNTLSDVSTAVAAAKAAVDGAVSNVMINLPSIHDKRYVEDAKKKVDGLKRESMMLIERTERVLQSRLSKPD